jgi:hypothetical protein
LIFSRRFAATDYTARSSPDAAPPPDSVLNIAAFPRDGTNFKVCIAVDLSVILLANLFFFVKDIFVASYKSLES